jgi:hypothetical protein
MESVVLDGIVLLPHIPCNIKSFLNHRDRPSSPRVLFLKRIDVSLVRVGPFPSGPTQQQLAPTNSVLFSDRMLSPPLIEALKFRQGTVAKMSPLPQAFENSSHNRRGRFQDN